MQVELKVLCVAAAIALGGCGNVAETISVGEWVEAGQPEPPIVEPSHRFTVETEQAGDGPIVKAGDLVKARLQAIDAGKISADQDVWVWVGREPALQPGERRSTSAAFASPGAARFRAALIGRRLHEKFSLRGTFSPDASDVVPVYALFTSPLTYHRVAEVIIDGEVSSSPDWPAIILSPPRDAPEVVARVEILQVCEARLYRRTAVMRQWGIPFRWATERPRNVRKGELGWTMIEAQCPPPEGHLRVQAGPFFDPELGSADELYDWANSYVNLRPPSKFPEEWQAERARPGMR
jgi:hypothetical protein